MIDILKDKFNNLIPLVKDSFRFVITYCKGDKNTIINTYNEMLEDSKHIICDDIIITIYNDKERVNLKSISEIITIDLNIKVKVFEGFLCNIKYKNILYEIINDVISYIISTKDYTNVCDLLLYLVKQNIDITKYKELIFSCVNDNDFYSILKGMLKYDLNVSKTSTNIYMHRNTLMNKLDNIESITTLNLKNFYDSFCIYMLFKESL